MRHHRCHRAHCLSPAIKWILPFRPFRGQAFTGTLYDHSAGINAGFHRFNSGTAYDGNSVGNTYSLFSCDPVPATESFYGNHG